MHPDFQIELVASEPLIFDPVDLEFDQAGDAYLIEMPGYPNGDEQGRLVLLTDSDLDGQYDQRTVFADSLDVATSLLPFQGGFLVASPPDLLFLKDTDGDGKEDVREILISGFSRLNTQHNFNGLNYWSR